MSLRENIPACPPPPGPTAAAGAWRASCSPSTSPSASPLLPFHLFPDLSLLSSRSRSCLHSLLLFSSLFHSSGSHPQSASRHVSDPAAPRLFIFVSFFNQHFSHSTVFNLLFSFQNVNKIFLFILDTADMQTERGTSCSQQQCGRPPTDAHSPPIIPSTPCNDTIPCLFTKLHFLSSTCYMNVVALFEMFDQN